MKLQITLLTFISCCLLSFQVLAESITREFPAKKGQKLVIDLQVGADIEIEGWDADRIQVRVISDEEASDFDIRFIKNSWGLQIEAEYTRKNDSHRGGDIELEIKVPRTFDLDLHTLGGDIDIEEIRGTIKGRTLGGDLELSALNGYVELSTLGGDIEVSDSHLDGKLKTMGGDVQFDDVTGSVDGKTLGGDISYNNYHPSKASNYDTDREQEREAYLREREAYDRAQEEAQLRKREAQERKIEAVEREREAYRREREAYRRKREEFRREREPYTESRPIKINKMGGEINVPNASAGAEVKTMGGDIIIHRANEFVVATTFGGDIEIKEVDGWVKAKTFAGDIEVRLVGDSRNAKRDVELISFEGDVELIVPKNLDMNIEIELAYTKNYKEQTKIVSDFPLDIEESEGWERSNDTLKRFLYAKGKTGSAQHSIRIETVNGNVYLKQE